MMPTCRKPSKPAGYCAPEVVNEIPGVEQMIDAIDVVFVLENASELPYHPLVLVFLRHSRLLLFIGTVV
jgi:hypothetical protein